MFVGDRGREKDRGIGKKREKRRERVREDYSVGAIRGLDKYIRHSQYILSVARVRSE